MTEWTLTLYPSTWLLAAIFIFMGGKMLQQGGRMYGEGKRWFWQTLSGLAFELAVIFGIGIALLQQN